MHCVSQAGAAAASCYQTSRLNACQLIACTQMQVAPAQLDGGPAVAVGGETGHHMEAVPAAPRLENLNALLPVSVPPRQIGLVTRGRPP